MCKKFFKRSVQRRSVMAIMVILLIGYVIISKQLLSTNETDVVIGAMIFFAVCLVLLLLIAYVLPPDFKYWISEEGDYIIFEKNETDHRPILRKYSIIKQTRNEIVLGDERGTIISIAYNAEVVEFLKQVGIK